MQTEMSVNGSSTDRDGLDPRANGSALEPLPREDCRVTISAEVPARLPGGGTAPIPCIVANRGTAVLLSAGPYPVHLAYRWFKETDGQLVLLEEGPRSGLPDPLAPGQSAACIVELRIPNEVGRFVLSLTLVQEHVAWLDDLDPDNAWRQPVRVTPAGPLDALNAEIRWMAECERRLRDVAAFDPGSKETAPASRPPSFVSNAGLDAERTAAARLGARLDSAVSKEQRYQQLIGEVRTIVQGVVPPGRTVLVANRGDARLLDFDHRPGWHFPEDPSGTYAGFYPADSSTAIEHLESLRERGAEYLVFPSPAFWWLDHYAELRAHLEHRYRQAWSDERCVIYDLDSSGEALRIPSSAPPRYARSA
jgi:hypothetical protein